MDYLLLLSPLQSLSGPLSFLVLDLVLPRLRKLHVHPEVRVPKVGQLPTYNAKLAQGLQIRLYNTGKTSQGDLSESRLYRHLSFQGKKECNNVNI